MIFSRQPTSMSFRPFNNPLVTVPKSANTVDIIFTCMLHSFFQFSSKVHVFMLLLIFFNFTQFSFFLIIIRSSLLAEIRGSVCMSKSHRSLYVILQDRCWVVNISFVRMVEFKFLAQVLVDHLSHPVVSTLILMC